MFFTSTTVFDICCCWIVAAAYLFTLGGCLRYSPIPRYGPRNYRLHDLPEGIFGMIPTHSFDTGSAYHIDVQGVINKAFVNAVNGGTAGASAAAVQVISLMWLRTTLNYQYRFGNSTIDALKTLYADGGIPRLYQGLPFAIVQGPLSRFGDTASNALIGSLVDSIDPLGASIPLPLRTALGSATASLWRLILMPVDTAKTCMQVNGRKGLPALWEQVKTQGPSVLYFGAIASSAATFVGHFPWFYTYNFLSANLPTPEQSVEHLLWLAEQLQHQEPLATDFEPASGALAHFIDTTNGAIFCDSSRIASDMGGHSTIAGSNDLVVNSAQWWAAALARSDARILSVLRSAFIGLCASSTSDIASNSLRVLKTARQTVTSGYSESTLPTSEDAQDEVETGAVGCTSTPSGRSRGAGSGHSWGKPRMFFPAKPAPISSSSNASSNGNVNTNRNDRGKGEPGKNTAVSQGTLDGTGYLGEPDKNTAVSQGTLDGTGYLGEPDKNTAVSQGTLDGTGYLGEPDKNTAVSQDTLDGTGYLDIARAIIAQDGLAGLFGRGLQVNSYFIYIPSIMDFLKPSLRPSQLFSSRFHHSFPSSQVNWQDLFPA